MELKSKLPSSNPLGAFSILQKKENHPHHRDLKEKGTTIDYNGRCAFLKPGDTYTDLSGRKYRVAEDGSLRRIKIKVGTEEKRRYTK